MAKLVIQKSGSHFDEVVLDQDREYTIGRDSSCDVVLKTTKGISRKHLVLTFDGEAWAVQIISRMNNLLVDGEPVKEFRLDDSLTGFEVYPYYFQIVPEASEEETEAEHVDPEDETQESPAANRENLPAVVSAHPSSDETGRNLVPAGGDDPTMMGLKRSRILSISITGTETGNDQLLQLDDEGPSWIAGRDPSCEIFIDDNQASRKHFKITKNSDQFFIEDLGSANGTELNGEFLEEGQREKLISGDKIQIMTVSLTVEVRDPGFEEQIEKAEKGLVAAPFYQPGIPYPANPGYPYPQGQPGYHMGANGPGAQHSSKSNQGFDWQKNKVKLAIGAMIPLLIAGLMMDSKPQKKPAQQTKEQASTSVSFDKLSPEKRSAVKDMFNLSQQYFHKLRYELCLSELRKLHKIIPQYENSKELKTFCEQGAALLKQEKDREAKEKKAQETQQRIEAIVQSCQASLTRSTTMEQMRDCLSGAAELDPEYPGILSIYEQIERREAEKRAEKTRKAGIARRIAKGRREYQKAVKLQKQDKLNAAVKQYDRFLNGRYPALRKEKAKAKREVASVRVILDQKIKELLNQCEALKSNNQFKEAWLTCDLASKENPESLQAKELKRQTLSDLRKEMKSIYQDSILEESLGNVEAAKEKWKNIMANDLEFDDYYKKAKRKLKKYGEGI